MYMCTYKSSWNFGKGCMLVENIFYHLVPTFTGWIGSICWLTRMLDSTDKGPIRWQQTYESLHISLAARMLHHVIHVHTCIWEIFLSCIPCINYIDIPSQGSAHTGREWSAPTTTRPFLPPNKGAEMLYFMLKPSRLSRAEPCHQYRNQNLNLRCLLIIGGHQNQDGLSQQR